jgi:hypothetical protein
VEDRLNNYISRAAFVNPAPFTFGNAGRFLENRAPGLQTWDVSFAKSFPIGERIHADLRAETFNLLNHPNFLAPASNLNNQLQFGTITGMDRPRNVQLALSGSEGFAETYAE